MRVTLKQYHRTRSQLSPDVGENLLDPDEWDTLRLSEDTNFSVGTTREEWVANCSRDGGIRYEERATRLAELVSQHGIERLFSVGVGGAFLEYHLSRQCPSLELVCSDYTQETVRRIRSVAEEFEDVVEFDLLSDPVAEYADYCFLIHRVDADLSNEEWRSAFRRLHAAGVETILFVVHRALTPRAVLREGSKRLRGRLTSDGLTFTGYLRTRSTAESLWADRYSVEQRTQIGSVESSPTYLLRRN